MHVRTWALWYLMLVVCFPRLCLAQTLPVGISLPPSLNFATSPNPVGSGARAQGKGLAFIGVADDATAASHNPAGLVQLQRPEASVVGAYFLRTENQDVTQPGIVLDDQTLHAFDLDYLSVAYPFQLLRRNVVVSLNYQRLFSLQGDTDVVSALTGECIDRPGRCLSGIQAVQSRQDGRLFTISPAVAVQITPALSVGIAVNIWPAILNNGWEQDVKIQDRGVVVSGPDNVDFVANGSIEEHYDFEGWNTTIGVLWKINRIFQVGGVVRTPFTAKVTRSHRSSLTYTQLDGSEPITTAAAFRETLDMDMPLSYGIGFAARLSDTFTVALDVSRIHWSEFRFEESTRDDQILVENGAPSGRGTAVLRGQGGDTTTVRLGAEYLWIRPRTKLIIPMRGGLFYDPEPSDSGVDAIWGASLGSGLVREQFAFDVAYTLRAGVVHSTATDTTAFQHTLLASFIYYF